MPAPRKSKLTGERVMVFAVGFLALVALAGIVAFVMSTARVRIALTVAPTPIATDFEVPVAGEGGSANAVRGRIVRVDGTANAQHPIGASGATPPIESPKRATGVVTIVNDRTEAQPLVATTRLQAPDGIVFRITKSVRVPAKGRVADVSVTADVVGSQANIGPTKFMIPGLSSWLQRYVYAESTVAMSGGQGKPGDAELHAPRIVVTQSDIDAVRADALDAARRNAQTRAEAQAGGGERAVLGEETAQVKMTGAVGDARDHVQAEVVVTAIVVVVDRAALEERARGALETIAVAHGRELRRFQADTMEIHVTAQDATAGTATLALHAEGVAVPGTQYRSFAPTRLSGFTADQVATYLRSIPGVSAVTVHFWPFWVNRVPTTASRVDIEVETAE